MPPYFKGEPRYEYFERTAFTFEQWTALKEACQASGVEFMSSPFSEQAVDLLERLDIALYKIPSGEVTNLPLLHAIAETGKPVLLSSGMSSWAELDKAVETLLTRHSDITVLQCTSAYPCPDEEVGLDLMLAMRERYHLPVGLSDHTLSPWAAVAAVALGATVIEKHFAFSRLMYGSDPQHSMEPAEFAELCQGVSSVERMLEARWSKDETSTRLAEMKRIFEKRVVATTPIPKGSVITPLNLGLKKAGHGLPASALDGVAGRRAARDIIFDQPITASDLVDFGNTESSDA
jgi:N-acetylneuraminate synthase